MLPFEEKTIDNTKAKRVNQGNDLLFF